MAWFCSDLPEPGWGSGWGLRGCKLTAVRAGGGLFKPMAVTVSFQQQGPHLGPVRHAAPEAPSKPTESEPGGSHLGFHTPPAQVGTSASCHPIYVWLV